MTNLVCIDRDGTINEDENYYLGSSQRWKDQARILPGVAEGIKILNNIPDTFVFIVTNQAGVALQGEDFDDLTEERMQEVNEYIIELLEKQGVRIEGVFACPYVDSDYVEKAKTKGRDVNLKYHKHGHEDLKPNIGMLKKAAASIDKNLEECNLFVIGDRKTDVEMGLNGKGTGILVSSLKTIELGDVEKVQILREKYGDKVYVAHDFLDAVRYVQAHI